MSCEHVINVLVRLQAQPLPETVATILQVSQAPWPSSWANTTYNSVNTFRFTNHAGQQQYVRWSMRPHTAFVAMSPQEREAADDNFLIKDLAARLERGPLRWGMALMILTMLFVGIGMVSQ